MFIKASKKDFHFPTESKNIRESPGKETLLHVICEMFSHILIRFLWTGTIWNQFVCEILLPSTIAPGYLPL